jgi:hypothetical protein
MKECQTAGAMNAGDNEQQGRRANRGGGGRAVGTTNGRDNLDDERQHGNDEQRTFGTDKHNGSTAPLSRQMRDSGAIVFLFFLFYFSCSIQLVTAASTCSRGVM